MSVTPRPPRLDPPRLDLAGFSAVVGGGTLGTLLRAGLLAVWPPAVAFPASLLAVNVAGALALGWLLAWCGRLGPDTGRVRLLRLGAGTGMLGGFTTWSALAVGVLSTPRPTDGLVLGLLSLVLGVAAAGCGLWLGGFWPATRKVCS